MKKINNIRLRDNVLYYSKLKNIKIGELEKMMGHDRPGIISRWAAKSSTIPVQDLYNISLILEVPMERLIEDDTNELMKEVEIKEINAQIKELKNKIKELRGEK